MKILWIAIIVILVVLAGWLLYKMFRWGGDLERSALPTVSGYASPSTTPESRPKPTSPVY